jgi:MGT family glycosyltransferase
MSVGDLIDLRHFQQVPPHIIIKRYLPQLEVLRRSDLFITHGGMNSVNEALYYHVPLIVIPKDADQPIIARRISELGAGVRMKRTRLTVQKLRDQAIAVLSNPTFADNARKIGETLAQAGGYQRAAKEIIDFQKRHRMQP